MEVYKAELNVLREVVYSEEREVWVLCAVAQLQQALNTLFIYFRVGANFQEDILTVELKSTTFSFRHRISTHLRLFIAL